MKADFKNTVLVAFENDLLDAPAEGERWGFFNGQLLPSNEFFVASGKAEFLFEQSFRSDFLLLDRAGFNVQAQFDANISFDAAIVFAGRTRKVNEANFARAWQGVKSGGKILIAGEKNTGIGSMRKWVKSKTTIAESISKYHAVCFWCEKAPSTEFDFVSDEQKGAGLFAAGEADRGSELLARYFDKRIKGKVADLGAGWGYLTQELLTKSPNIESVDLYEADWHALEAAKQNVSNETSASIDYHWTDIPGEFKKRPYEWIVMNPPFHHGLHVNRAADPGLGKAFIQTAASSLVHGGKLLMVANRNLPYEETLQKAFRKSVKIADEAGYKVFEAVK